MMSGVMGMHLRQILGTANSGWYQIKDPNRWVQGFFYFIFFTMVNSGLKIEYISCKIQTQSDLISVLFLLYCFI